MNTEEYVKSTSVTDEKSYHKIQARMSDEMNSKLIHYALGMGTEAAEIQDAVKKTTVYGKELDRTNIIEELGDSLWYIARMIELLDTSFEEVMDKNIAKLKARYGDKFTEHAALNRNLDKERKILEKTLK